MQQGYVSLINNRVIRDGLFWPKEGCPGPLEGPKTDLNDLGKIAPYIFLISRSIKCLKNQTSKNEHPNPAKTSAHALQKETVLNTLDYCL